MNWYRIIEWLDLPNLQSIILGDYAFLYTLSIVIESIDSREWDYRIDLPSLETIELGRMALGGSTDTSCSLAMRSNNNTIWSNSV